MSSHDSFFRARISRIRLWRIDWRRALFRGVDLFQRGGFLDLALGNLFLGEILGPLDIQSFLDLLNLVAGRLLPSLLHAVYKNRY